MNASLLLLLATFAALSILMVLALVPYSMELIEPSADFSESRRRLRDMGAVGRATAWSVPRVVDQRSPRRVWRAIYFTIWALIVVSGVLLSFAAPNPGMSVAKNVAIVLGIAAGFLSVHAAIIALGRAIHRANRRLESEPVREDEREELVQSSSPPPKASPSRLSSFLGLAGMLSLVIALRILADHLPVLNEFHALTQRHPIPARTIVIGAAAVGFTMFMTSAIMLALGAGVGRGRGSAREMSHEEVEAMYAQNMRSMQGTAAIARAARYRIRGETYGRTGYDEWSFRAMKDAWRSGAWRSDPIWRRRYLGTAGALLMTVGLFGIPSILGPPWVMLLCGLALLYALVRTTWAFWRC